ncbi:sensor histidine kinase [Nocardioides xinjiangensis]|uniref:sensor histidine kinase n=1 Tax=Nocardioides xinjiangensis TaxID=2817376 RepID=UPI001B302247|nr:MULTISPECIES: ATP-binding protein [unclassified Nocardioides]
MHDDRPGPADRAKASLGENALSQGVERYASMFSHHPHAAYSVDRRGYYTDANPRALAMTGLTLEQMRQTHFSEVIHPDDVHIIQAGFDRALAGEPQVEEARVLRADGEVVHIRCTAIPVVVCGEVVGLHGITEDITESKRVLRELEEANAAKSLFLATVSHEIRTPLAVLVGATDLLLDAELEPEPDHYAQMVRRSSQRLLHLVNDILEFSGLEAHRTVLTHAPFDVRALVADVAEWAVPSAEDRGLVASFEVDGSVPATAVGDALRITQVVTNLVQNAIKFTEQGTVDVRVTSQPEPAPGAGTWLDFTVTDSGIGIAPDRLHALFEPFTQADPQYAGQDQGIGLGLAICRQLADLMDARLEVSSVLGEGSTFTFRLPLVQPGDEPPSPTD